MRDLRATIMCEVFAGSHRYPKSMETAAVQHPPSTE